MLSLLSKYIDQNTEAAPLAVFRILFGLLMCVAVVRFWYRGWIEKLYLLPPFHFHYYGFEFIQVPGRFTYVLFVISAISALTVAFGYKYKASIFLFFLTFTYIELMDKTTYLNHYYFVSIVAFLLIWLPAGSYFSADSYLNPSLRRQFVPKWTIDILKVFIGIVYIYAGAAKLNPDWMVHAMPLSIWLPSKFNAPIIGSLMHFSWTHYFFSWAGALYDLTIVFFLLCNRTRNYAFFVVVLFHVLTSVLFPIGMFPYIMIFSALIFFSSSFHINILDTISKVFRVGLEEFNNGLTYTFKGYFTQKMVLLGLSFFMMIQVLFPLRSHLYPGNIMWTEQGYRFSWRVMLMEKTGYAQFKIVDQKTKKQFYVQNDDFLTSLQIKQMSTQPDMIVEYGQFLGNHFADQGHENVAVYVDSYASLNGRRSQRFIRSDVDLMTLNDSWANKNYIIPLND